MHSIQFSKMSVNGNNFVILDETNHTILNESQKSEFAYYATNTNFGVGCDNMLVIQRFNREVMSAINDERSYWQQLPNDKLSNYIFRMFEPNGEEALSCGNGLKCIAKYLYRKYGLTEAQIMTEVPLDQPSIVKIGTDEKKQTNWVNLGFPRKVPQTLYQPKNQKAINEQIDLVDNIKISLRENDLQPYSEKKQLILSGYLVFTGEPHLVIFDSGLSIPDIWNTLFAATSLTPVKQGGIEKRINFGHNFIQLIGSILNKSYRNVFPAGININFARYLPQQRAVEYRCFERGIEKETLACGTGALAVAFIMKHLKLVTDSTIRVWPHLCNQYQPNTEIKIEEKPNGWKLSSTPKYLFDGNYYFNSKQNQFNGKDKSDKYKYISSAAEI